MQDNSHNSDVKEHAIAEAPIHDPGKTFQRDLQMTFVIDNLFCISVATSARIQSFLSMTLLHKFSAHLKALPRFSASGNLSRTKAPS